MAEIEYYSPSQKVSMADAWFDVATLEHFWVQRRFEVFQRLLGADASFLQPVAEIGCGHGLVQAQFKRTYGLGVDGFELNEYALSKSVASDQPRFIYDIHDRKEELKEKYGLIVLFDVIEHIEQEADFLQAVLFHLKKGGLLAVNVPALQLLYSNYDRAAGHVRRYSIKQLEALGDKLGLQSFTSTYWGMPLLPLLAVRKALLAFRSGEQETIDQGFRPPSALANRVLKALSAAEPMPQSFLGTSAMCIFRNRE
jgi:SAM-dependent methyltransferase